jgi:hypothetical protein
VLGSDVEKFDVACPMGGKRKVYESSLKWQRKIHQSLTLSIQAGMANSSDTET